MTELLDMSYFLQMYIRPSKVTLEPLFTTDVQKVVHDVHDPVASQLEFRINADHLALALGGVDLTSTDSPIVIDAQTWVMVGYSLLYTADSTATKISLFAQKTEAGLIEVKLDNTDSCILVDDGSGTKVIGRSAGSTSYYEGFLYYFCIDSIVSLDDIDVISPPDTSNCEKNQYNGCEPEEECCTDCLEECETCVRGENCTPCIDDLCLVCSSFEQCQLCNTGAVVNADGICECDIGFVQSLVGDKYECVACPESCETCVQVYETCNYCCDICDSEYVKSPQEPANDICLPRCPDGFEADSSGVCVGAGYSQCTYFVEKDPEFGVSSYNRGTYLSNSDGIPLQVEFNHSFVIMIWSRFDEPRLQNVLFTGKDYQWYSRDTSAEATSDGIIEFLYLQTSISGSTVDLSNWHRYVLTVNLVDNVTTSISFDVDLDNVALGTVPSYLFDNSDNLIANYVGFVYGYCITTSIDAIDTDITFPTPECTDNTCDSCPLKDGTSICLVNCDFGEYLDGETCGTCSEECTDGCENGEDCILCVLPRCIECEDGYETCSLCEDNSSLDENSLCACDVGYFEGPEQESCQQCYTGCASCSSTSYADCEACMDDYYLYANAQICNASVCPTNYLRNADTNQCDLNEAGVSCIVFNTNIAPWIGDNELTANTEFTYITAVGRGLYFSGEEYLTLTGILLDTTFSLEIWIRPEKMNSLSTLFSINQPMTEVQGAENFFDVQYLNQNIRLRIGQGATYETEDNSLTAETWHATVVSLEWVNPSKTQYRILINDVLKANGEFDEVLYDRIEYNHILGAELNTVGGETNFYNGFMYKFCVHSDFEVTLDPALLICEVEAEKDCVVDCPLKEYLEAGNCSPCKESCTEGCKDSHNCNKCMLNACDVCMTYLDETCEVCLSFANNDCSDCVAPYEYKLETHECKEPPPCDESCTTCTQKGNPYACTGCAEGYYLQPGGLICRRYCPTGYDKDEVNRECIDDPRSNYVEWDFFDVISYGLWIDESHEKDAVTGTLEQIETQKVPIPLKDRGIYFADSQDNYLTLSDVYIHYVNSFETWLLVTIPGLVYINKNTEEIETTVFELITKDDNTYELKYQSNSIATSDTYAPNTWMLVFFQIEWQSGANSDIMVVVNNSVLNLSTEGPVLDRLYHVKNIGSPAGDAFSGFMYNFKIYNYIASIPALTSVAGCACGSICPSNTCLDDCEANSFRSGDECVSCRDDCTLGCVRAENCNLCDGPACEACATFTSECDRCIPEADLADGECTCRSGADQYDINLDIC